MRIGPWGGYNNRAFALLKVHSYTTDLCLVLRSSNETQEDCPSL